jgi:glycosyltransferase involved in cell wall biosynthesis
VAEGLCSAEKIKVLRGGSGNGVDATGRFNPSHFGEYDRQQTRAKHGIPADALVVGYVGRIVRDKGLVELATAWRNLRHEFPTLHLLIAGRFEPQDPLPRDIEDLLRGDSRIHLAGHVENISSLYAAMDLVILPSYREGFPKVPLEAAAMALPVVATRIPGCVDAVKDGATATLVPPRDAEALAEAIRMYLHDPALRRQHGQVGREWVLKNFHQEELWEAMYQEYVHLLRKKGLPVPEANSINKEAVSAVPMQASSS